MIIDVSKLLLNMEEEIEVKDNILIPEEYLNNCNIKRLETIYFDGSIIKLIDDSLELTGIINGKMILPDDITLEDVEYQFNIKIEEKLENLINILDITDILWQNILVEIPSKVHSPKNENVAIKGDGWRVITEDEFLKEQSSNNPFTELKQMIEESEDR